MKKLRGYITSRRYLDNRVPQHVQNIVIRDYCFRNDYKYLLSSTEYAIVNCYMMLENVLKELDSNTGIALYSIFLLPNERHKRFAIYNKIINSKSSLHGVVENICLKKESDISFIEDIILVQGVLTRDSDFIFVQKNLTEKVV